MRQGFSLNSAHYLIKPVQDEDFAQAMENCRVRRECQVPSLEVTIGQQPLELDTRDILYLDIEGRTVVIHTVEGALPAGRSFSAPPLPSCCSPTSASSRATAACW